jgi:hypothetical protein
MAVALMKARSDTGAPFPLRLPASPGGHPAGVHGEAWSAYDASVPAAAHGSEVLDRLAAVRRLRGAGAPGLEQVRELVVVVSSSRGGSSLLGELLRHVDGLVHLSAESNPSFLLARSSPGRERKVLADELAADLGQADDSLDERGRHELLLQAAWRLVMQWPSPAIDVDDVRREAGLTLDDLVREEGWPPDRFIDRAAFTLRLLERLRGRHPEIDPWYYDVPEALVRRRFPGIRRPEGPPAGALVEMPPFVCLRPWRRADAATLAAGTVVLTTPRNAFRLPVLRHAFPAARLRVVHLVRNPAAAVNGLMDGWRHRGFFNCRVERALGISGYSDRYAWGRSWWNYDFPPGWEALVDLPLAAVCAEQWRSPHLAALQAADDDDLEVLRLRFEDVVGPPEIREPALARLAGWLGLDEAGRRALRSLRLPPVMATAPPAPARWRASAEELGPVLADPATMELAERLGYASDPASWR